MNSSLIFKYISNKEKINFKIIYVYAGQQSRRKDEEEKE